MRRTGSVPITLDAPLFIDAVLEAEGRIAAVDSGHVEQGSSGFHRTFPNVTLPIAELKSGMVLLQNISTNDGRNLFSADMVLTETSMNILQQWNTKENFEQMIRVRLNG